MRRFIYTLFLLAGIISVNTDIGRQEAQAMPSPKSDPIAHKASGDTLVFSDVLNQQGDVLVAGHYSHSSHSSHSSHASHYSSRF